MTAVADHDQVVVVRLRVLGDHLRRVPRDELGPQLDPALRRLGAGILQKLLEKATLLALQRITVSLDEPLPIEYLAIAGVMLEIVPSDAKVASGAAGSVGFVERGEPHAGGPGPQVALGPPGDRVTRG